MGHINLIQRLHKTLCMDACAVLSHSVSKCLTLCNPMDCSPPGSSVLGESPGKKTGVDYHARLQGIFPTQVSNPRLPHYRQILYCLSHQGSPIKIICRGKKKKNRTLGTAICL